MISNLLSAPWKLATAAAAVIAIVVGVMLFMSYNDNQNLEGQKQELVRRIEDPKTGYVARLTQANANVVTLRAAIETTNRQLELRKDESAKSNAELNRLRRELLVAQAETRQMETRLRQFLATKPQGATLEARVRDIDARILKELSQ